MYDITLLADSRYVNAKPDNPYLANVAREDQLVREALKSVGLKVNRVAWDDPTVDWSTTRYTLIREVWDYFERYPEFFPWFEATAKKTTFINSKDLIDWNIDKHYLMDLEDSGVNIPATVFVEAGTTAHLGEVIENAKLVGLRSDELVLKPCVAGGARHTYLFHRTEWEKHNAIFQELLATEAMMLQEFQHNIVSQGEISIMVFDGTFTHAVLKKAKTGDFRVQDDWGGTVHDYQPSQEEIDFALNAFNQCPEKSMYGRADIFRDNNGNLALAELEVFEPELWFRKCPEAASTMAKAIMNTYFL